MTLSQKFPGGRCPGKGWVRGDVAGFDAEFFRGYQAEATSIDPQQRLLLEIVGRSSMLKWIHGVVGRVSSHFYWADPRTTWAPPRRRAGLASHMAGLNATVASGGSRTRDAHGGDDV